MRRPSQNGGDITDSLTGAMFKNMRTRHSVRRRAHGAVRATIPPASGQEHVNHQLFAGWYRPRTVRHYCSAARSPVTLRTIASLCRSQRKLPVAGLGEVAFFDCQSTGGLEGRSCCACHRAEVESPFRCSSSRPGMLRVETESNANRLGLTGRSCRRWPEP